MRRRKTKWQRRKEHIIEGFWSSLLPMIVDWFIFLILMKLLGVI
jgi:hypothetical protein